MIRVNIRSVSNGVEEIKLDFQTNAGTGLLPSSSLKPSLILSSLAILVTSSLLSCDRVGDLPVAGLLISRGLSVRVYGRHRRADPWSVLRTYCRRHWYGGLVVRDELEVGL